MGDEESILDANVQKWKEGNTWEKQLQEDPGQGSCQHGEKLEDKGPYLDGKQVERNLFFFLRQKIFECLQTVNCYSGEGDFEDTKYRKCNCQSKSHQEFRCIISQRRCPFWEMWMVRGADKECC